jgi:hypothetical protein
LDSNKKSRFFKKRISKNYPYIVNTINLANEVKNSNNTAFEECVKETINFFENEKQDCNYNFFKI